MSFLRPPPRVFHIRLSAAIYLPQGEVKRVDKIRVCIAAAIFVLLTAIKLLFPAQMGVLRQEAQRLAGTDWDYRAAVTALGRGLSDRELGEKLIAVWREYAREEAESGR